MNINDENPMELLVMMLVVKVGTLMYHLPAKEVKRFINCEYKLDTDGQNYVPVKLHTWVNKNHIRLEKYHKEFVVPEHMRIPFSNPIKD